MSKQNDFWNELESRLDENTSLSQGGVPDWLKPMAAYVGMHFWQSLFMFSGLMIVVLTILLQDKIIGLAETILLIL